ncbi:MAG: iron-sulfur cluster repair di-iron protein [Pirellula sp.]|jgi:regulator of cell morphogenesis and NO signaling|nr:iron-sulfur cluster repair di-iron protein [Pirellula sp.]
MLTLDTNQTVGQFVRENPNCARVFEQLQIDYCCGGKVPLATACEKRGVDTQEVLRLLADCIDSDLASDEVDADKLSLTQLCDHIESTHHAYLKTELPRLDHMTEKVARVHGDKDTRLHRVRDAFVALRSELEPHMMKEERILFPIIRSLETSSTRQEFHCGSVANPIRQMESEHDHAGNELSILNQSTDGYTPPDWACNTYRAMLDALKRLESNMHQHVHKENNVLFPKAIQLEQSR